MPGQMQHNQMLIKAGFAGFQKNPVCRSEQDSLIYNYF
jgi:hypothetical protein